MMAPSAPPFEIETGTVDIGGGVELYWEASGTGRPIVFVHGLWASSRFFRRQLMAIGQQHRAIALDLRGHGRSAMTPGGHTVPTLAADLHAFLRALSIERPILVGWSMGAFIAWDYHLQFGSADIAGLVVVDQAPTDFRYDGMEGAIVGLPELRDWTSAVLTNRNDFMKIVLPMMFHVPPSAEDADWMWNEMCRAPASISASIFVDQCLRDYRPMISSYDVPTLVCSGTYSAQPRAGAVFLHENIPDSRLQMFDESGHCLFLEETEKVHRRATRFHRAD